ncbi:DsbA family protein [Sphingomonas sp.]|uniref:DsbA family protein n=1 Tax=Sphingomonas sp. TaxID=28214 RepID=UPI0025F9EE55|nr:DsbA family protein [Sphingomonas sp.]
MSDVRATTEPKIWGPAIVGGVVGALLTGVIGMVAAPHLVGPKQVREALLADPSILIDTATALRDRQYAPVLAANRIAIETPFASSWKGAAKPDVTLVEFYDYACGYCRKSIPDIERLLAEDKGLRVVFRELPILGPNSVAAARVALAASKAGKFSAYHDALYAEGSPTPETIAAVAGKLGVPGAPVDSPEFEAELKRNFQLAGQLGATGTPLFVIGDRVINAAVGYDALKKAVSDARAAKG